MAATSPSLDALPSLFRGLLGRQRRCDDRHTTTPRPCCSSSDRFAVCSSLSYSVIMAPARFRSMDAEFGFPDDVAANDYDYDCNGTQRDMDRNRSCQSIAGPVLGPQLPVCAGICSKRPSGNRPARYKRNPTPQSCNRVDRRCRHSLPAPPGAFAKKGFAIARTSASRPEGAPDHGHRFRRPCNQTHMMADRKPCRQVGLFQRHCRHRT